MSSDGNFPRNELLIIYYVLHVGGNYVMGFLYLFEPLDLRWTQSLSVDDMMSDSWIYLCVRFRDSLFRCLKNPGPGANIPILHLLNDVTISESVCLNLVLVYLSFSVYSHSIMSFLFSNVNRWIKAA